MIIRCCSVSIQTDLIERRWGLFLGQNDSFDFVDLPVRLMFGWKRTTSLKQIDFWSSDWKTICTSLSLCSINAVRPLGSESAPQMKSLLTRSDVAAAIWFSQENFVRNTISRSPSIWNIAKSSWTSDQERKVRQRREERIDLLSSYSAVSISFWHTSSVFTFTCSSFFS